MKNMVDLLGVNKKNLKVELHQSNFFYEGLFQTLEIPPCNACLYFFWLVDTIFNTLKMNT